MVEYATRIDEGIGVYRAKWWSKASEPHARIIYINDRELYSRSLRPAIITDYGCCESHVCINPHRQDRNTSTNRYPPPERRDEYSAMHRHFNADRTTRPPGW